MNDRGCVGVDGPPELEDVPRGPVGMAVVPPGVAGTGDGPDICLEGAWPQPVREPMRWE